MDLVDYGFESRYLRVYLSVVKTADGTVGLFESLCTVLLLFIVPNTMCVWDKFIFKESTKSKDESNTKLT